MKETLKTTKIDNSWKEKPRKKVFDLSFFNLAKIKGAPINECHKMSDFKRKKLE